MVLFTYSANLKLHLYSGCAAPPQRQINYIVLQMSTRLVCRFCGVIIDRTNEINKSSGTVNKIASTTLRAGPSHAHDARHTTTEQS
jgi:hypothetical protein